MKQIRFEEEDLKENPILDVKVELGDVEILPHDGCSVIVEAEVRDMVVDVHRQDNTVSVRVDVDEAARFPWLRLGKWWDNGPKATLTIHIPADCEIRANTVTGRLAVQDVQAPVTTRVVTGNTKLTNIAGPIYAKTTTGKLQYTGLLMDDKHRFETTTGSLLLRLPQAPNARLDASTTTGSLHCDFPLDQLKHENHMVGAKLRGTLGSGAGRIKARVVTGKLLVEQI